MGSRQGIRPSCGAVGARAASAQGSTLLIVEDDPGVREELAAMLRGEGLDVVVEPHGADGAPDWIGDLRLVVVVTDSGESAGDRELRAAGAPDPSRAGEQPCAVPRSARPPGRPSPWDRDGHVV
jgi:hypothetical protein